MKNFPIKSALLFSIWVVVLTAGMAGIRGAIAWAAETRLYPIPIAGGLLKSIEIAELSNVLIFALYGLGLGMATVHLPPLRRFLSRAGVMLAMLTLAVGLFCVSYGVRQHLWIQQVAAQASISFAEAQTMTNEFLETTIGSKGFWGFYRFTTQVPILPTTPNEIASLADNERWFRSELTRFSGLEPGIFSRLFSIAGWGIRGFYMAVAGLTFIIYFFKGLDWVEHRRIMHRPHPIAPGAARFNSAAFARSEKTAKSAAATPGHARAARPKTSTAANRTGNVAPAAKLQNRSELPRPVSPKGRSPQPIIPPPPRSGQPNS